MKKTFFKTTGNMKFRRTLIAGLIAGIALVSCKKDVITTPVIIHNYEGDWKNTVPTPTQGPLDFFNFTTKLVNGGTGTLDAAYIQPANQYPQTSLTWQKISGDSVVITLNIPAYPNEKWELRGIANNGNTKIVADYFSTPNNNPAGKHKYGTLVLTKL